MILENPNQYIGRTVSVAGAVEDAFGHHAFTLDSGLLSGELLVLSAQPLPTAGGRGYQKNDHAAITGTVRTMVTAEIEQELGWDLERKLEIEFDKKPVLIVSNIAFSPSSTSVAQKPDSTAPASVAQNSADSTTTTTDTSDRTAASKTANDKTMSNESRSEDTRSLQDVLSHSNPEELSGERVKAEEALVQRVVSDRGFWVGPSEDKQLFVSLDESETKGPDSRVKVREGQKVSFSGEVRKVPSLEDSRDRWQLDQKQHSELQEQEVYVNAVSIEID